MNENLIFLGLGMFCGIVMTLQAALMWANAKIKGSRNGK